MKTMSAPQLVADLRALGIAAGSPPVLPEGARPAAEVLDRWARAAALGDPPLRQAAIWAIREAARACGLMTAFFPRPSEYGPRQQRDYAAESAWDYVAADIEDLATQLGV